MPKPEATQLLTIAETAQHLRVSRSTVFELFKSGSLGYHRVLGRRLVSLGAIERFLDANAVEPSGARRPIRARRPNRTAAA